MIKVKITKKGANQYHVLPMRRREGHHVTSERFLQGHVACIQLRGSNRQTQTEGILCSSWPRIFQNIKAMKDKENLRNCLKLEDVKEIGQPSTV